MEGRNIRTVVNFKDHIKPAVSACFSYDGSRIASASYDKTVMIYRRLGDSFEKCMVARLETTPECCLFCPNSHFSDTKAADSEGVRESEPLGGLVGTSKTLIWFSLS